MRNHWLKPALLLALGLNISSAFAATDHQHMGDIQPWKVGGQIYTNGSLFEADFGDFYRGNYVTQAPGFDADTAKGAFGAGNWLRFQGLGALKFWDGSIWSNTVPNGEYIEIEDAIGNTTTFTASGVSNPIGVIDQLDAEGDLHSHLDMTIKTASNDKGGSIGAYWIMMQIFETAPGSLVHVSTASAPFAIIFNRGLDHEAFETAVSAVPVPSAVWLFGSALIGLLSAGRRRRTMALRA
ncbi:hypothetical protein [Methylicorpusculum sp.]|uniref:hypothetical protein n=1 Tax=Methylicorpusculum sp. TaxID=2713644 RepID=UPI002731A7D6|nr:hypothetical protein [Methylicorpusculum sp.]MDP2179244.1 hypothetical protein [Methylicorpusculum sp.]MDP3530026.1 hypothetical protein [Methylicorpusculum sp.]MDZ4152916.1 hypothetical protein [Methylicorpusculum sp.]